MKPPKIGFDAFKSFISKDLASYAKSPKFLNVSVAIGWMLAGVANCIGIVNNKELTNAERKFLIPQEITDCALNILLFFGVTLGFKKVAMGLVKKPVINESIISLMHSDSEIVKKAATGVETIAGIASAVVCSNIITPLIRNRLAAGRQAQYLESIGEKAKTMTTGAPKAPHSPEAARAALNMKNDLNAFITRTNGGSLKI